MVADPRTESCEEYPLALDALDERLRADPCDPEAVIRLGFNLWYAVVENDRLGTHLPTDQYAIRFMELFTRYKDRLADNADFCWAFGLGMSLFWYEFPHATEALGNALLARAQQLDPFWKRLMRQENVWFRWLWRLSPRLYRLCTRRKCAEEAQRLRSRGILASYYGVRYSST